jgi:peptide chain release factor 1
MSTPAMQARLESLVRRYEELTANLSSPSLVGNREAFAKASKEHSELAPVVEAYRRWQRTVRELAENEEMTRSGDKELADLAYEEVGRLRALLPAHEAELNVLLTPKDPHEGKAILLEIRAGTGGDEAALFAGDLFRMYSKYAANKGWRLEVLDASETEGGGYKEVVAMLDGSGVYRNLRWESGVHRVQRVPETEASGRKHTSTATVAVMPEVEEQEVDIRTDDLKVDTYRSGGAGGQHVNKTESAIRITHLPSGIVVTCQMERSQHKNRATAMKMLAAKLKDREREERESRISADRASQVGTGDRSERIRTYNFHEGRVSDHRIKLNLHRLPEIMDGDLDELLGALVSHYQAEALKAGEGEAARSP